MAHFLARTADAVNAVVGVRWYPLALYARLLRAIDQQIGAGDLRAIPPIGRFEAERDLPTIHRLLLKMVNPAYVVDKVAELWPRYHSTGELRSYRVSFCASRRPLIAKMDQTRPTATKM